MLRYIEFLSGTGIPQYLVVRLVKASLISLGLILHKIPHHSGYSSATDLLGNSEGLTYPKVVLGIW